MPGIQPLAWELPCAAGEALKTKKKKKKKKNAVSGRIPISFGDTSFQERKGGREEGGGRKMKSSFVKQQVKDPASSLQQLDWLLRLGFNPWLRYFHMPGVWPTPTTKKMKKLGFGV